MCPCHAEPNRASPISRISGDVSVRSTGILLEYPYSISPDAAEYLEYLCSDKISQAEQRHLIFLAPITKTSKYYI
jgi:hypothetical protein